MIGRPWSRRIPGQRQSHLSKASRKRMTTVLALATALARLMSIVPPVASTIAPETSAARAMMIRVQFGLGTRDADPLPGFLDDVARVGRDPVGPAAEEHQQFARLRPGVVGALAAEPVPEVAEDGLHVVVAASVAEAVVRDVVNEALEQVAGVVARDDAVVVELTDEALDAADDLLVAATRRIVLRDAVVVVLLREVVDRRASALRIDAVAAVVHARRVVAVEGEAGNDVGVEAVCAGRDADVLVRSRLDGSGAEGRDHRSLDAAAELRRRHRLGDGRVAELGRRHPGGVAPAVELDRLV